MKMVTITGLAAAAVTAMMFTPVPASAASHEACDRYARDYARPPLQGDRRLSRTPSSVQSAALLSAALSMAARGRVQAP